MALPILTFDPQALGPRLSYVLLSRRRLQPYESVVSLRWKFARLNLLAGPRLVTQLRSNPVDPYEGIGPADIDVAIVARLLGVTRRSVAEGMITMASHGCRFVRYCPRCMSLGYHGVVHQRERHVRCPIHHLPLLATCRHCGQASEYRLDAQLLGAPFRCRHCRRFYTEYATAPPLPGRQLKRDWRIAVTRLALGLA